MQRATDTELCPQLPEWFEADFESVMTLSQQLPEWFEADFESVMTLSQQFRIASLNLLLKYYLLLQIIQSKIYLFH